MQILVLGMHRSRTSMVARLLNMMGAYFAAEGISTGADQENPKGFWEHLGFILRNDELLSELGGTRDLPPRIEAGWENMQYADLWRAEYASLWTSQHARAPIPPPGPADAR
jgi:hypothetical protein